MLKRLYSPAFKENGVVRDPIEFHNGLNVILGEEEGYNSIGKSSALLAIDFAFSGDTYLKSTGVKKISDHTIFFTFEFDGVEYNFGRNTASAEQVQVCDEKYNFSGDIWTKGEFTDWLQEKYGLNFPGLGFRQTLSSFFRIYGKENLDERHPLRGLPGDGMQKSIERLVKLFNRYEAIEGFQNKLNEKTEKLSTFKKARDYQYIPNMVGGQKQYEANQVEIRRLQTELDNLTSEQVEIHSNDDIEKSKQQSRLKDDLFRVEEQVDTKERRLKLLDMSLEYGLYPTEADLSGLQEFFPEANIRKIYEIEGYHRKLAKILSGQFTDEKSSVEEEIRILKQEAESIRHQIKELGFVGNLSKEFLDRHSEIKGKIDLLTRQNDAYQTQVDLEDAKKLASEELKKAIGSILRDIENQINDQMKKYNDCLFEDYHRPPHLELKAFNSYSFETPDDDGTGSNFRGMILFDLSVLKLTALPAIAHDTNLFGEVWNRSIDEVIKLYAESTKQIFIAFDKQSKFSKETQAIVNDRAVLRLSFDGRELYGWPWNKEESENEDKL